MRRCDKCNNGPLEKSIKPEHIEDLGGIVVKILNAVVVTRCGACGDEMTAIPDIQGLGRAAAIARALCAVRLAGREVKFIRHAMDMTQKEFAAAMDLSAEHVSRWENDHTGIGIASEKLLRHNVCALLQKAGACDYNPADIANMQFVSLRNGEVLPPIEMVRVRIKNRNEQEDTWDRAAA
jgi:putative zinc finger/helix-turn-helix YgiT family protein